MTTSSLNSEDAPRAPVPRDERVPEAIGRFTVKATLGRGGQGTVYLAIDPVLGRSVAIKVRHLPEPAHAQHEATAAARVTHPNVVQVFDSGWTFDGRPFAVMQYLPGGSLTRWAAAEPRSVEQLVERFVEVGEGLAAIHEQGLLHCDVKPDNVILKDDGTAALSDFGLARSPDDAESRAGTRAFMAPELLASGRASELTDQYAYCVSLYLLLTRHYPEPVVERLKLPPGQTMAPWVRGVLERGLRALPDARFSNMRELLTALRQNPQERRRRALTLTLVATALIVTTGSLTAWALRETPEERAARQCAARADAIADELWSPTLVSNAQRHFKDVGGPEGLRTFEALRQRISPEVTALVGASHATCRLRDPIERRNVEACLMARHAVLRTTGDFLVNLRPDDLPTVLRMLSFELKPVEACRSTLGAAPALGESDADRELRVDLAPASVLRAAQRFDEAHRLAIDVLARAEASDADWARAEALLAAGLALADSHDGAAAARLQSAITAAERVGADEVRARAWIALVGVHVYRREFPLANRASANASAVVHRLGAPDLLVAPLLNAEGNRLYALGELAEANRNFREYRALLLKTRRPDDPLVRRADANVAQSEVADEVRVAAFVALVTESRAQLGDEHPETLRLRVNLASAWLGSLQCAEAEQEAARLVQLEAAAAQPALARGRAAFLHARALACLGETGRACTAQRAGLDALRPDAPPDAVLGQELDFAWEVCPAQRAALVTELCDLGRSSPDPSRPCGPP